MFQTKTVEKIQVLLKSDKNNGTLHEDRKCFRKSHREKSKHIFFVQ